MFPLTFTLSPLKLLLIGLAAAFLFGSGFSAGNAWSDYQHDQDQQEAKGKQDNKIEDVVDKSIEGADAAKASGAAHGKRVDEIVDKYEHEANKPTFEPAVVPGCPPAPRRIRQSTMDAINAIVDDTNHTVDSAASAPAKKGNAS